MMDENNVDASVSNFIPQFDDFFFESHRVIIISVASVACAPLPCPPAAAPWFQFIKVVVVVVIK